MLNLTTTQEAAKQLGVSTRTLRRWIAGNLIPAPEMIKIGGQKFWNWKPADLGRARKCKAQMRPGRKPQETP
jgi:excisionase family DNA binding protein